MTSNGVPNADAASTDGANALIAKPKDTAVIAISMTTSMKMVARDGSGFNPTILQMQCNHIKQQQSHQRLKI